jgi:Na+/melibiose symporter-like transporter
MRAAFSEKRFRRLFVGVTASMFGDSVMLLVLSMWVKSITGSNAAAGLTFFWMLLPSLVAPLLGMFVDRLRPKPVLVWGSAASAAAVLPLTLVHDAGDVWIVYAVAVLYGVSFVVLPAALNGLLKELVPDEQLVEANSTLQTVKEGFRLVGPLLGAALFAGVGGGAVALLDSASFVVAAVVVATIPVHEDRPVREQHHWWHEMTAGIRHLVTDRLLRHTLVAFGLMLLVLGFTEASIYAIVDVFGKPVEFVSVIVTVQGVGAVAGGVTATRWVRWVGEIGTIAVGTVLMAVSLAVIAATHSLPVLLVDVVLFGYSIPLLLVAFTTMVQRRTPLPIMGRVSAATEVVLGTPQAVSLAGGALLVTLLDYHLIYAIMAAVTAAAAAYLLVALGRQVWRPVAPWAPPPSPERRLDEASSTPPT